MDGSLFTTQINGQITVYHANKWTLSGQANHLYQIALFKPPDLYRSSPETGDLQCTPRVSKTTI